MVFSSSVDWRESIWEEKIMKISEIILSQGIQRRFRGPRKPRLKQKGFHARMKGLLDSQQVNEGGAMPGVGVIHHSEIKPTLLKLEKELGIPLLKNALGSVGKKEFSGDIDIAVKLDKDQIADFAERLEAAPSIQEIKKSSVFMTVVDIIGYDDSKQVQGKERTGKVQIDFMPGDVDFMKNYYHSPHSKEMSQDGRHSNYKGIHRNIMIASIAGALEVKASDDTTSDGRPLEMERWMFSPSDGMVRVIRRPVEKKNGIGHTKANKNEIVKGPFKDPKDWAKILKLDNADDLYSFESLYAAVKKNYPADVAKSIFKNFKDNPSIQNAGVPTELGESFGRANFNKQLKRKGIDVDKMHSDNVKDAEAAKKRSKDAQKDLDDYRKKHNLKEADARIQHVEDFAIWHGATGVAKSINTLKNLEKSPENVTVKWDGSPAVIFGRNENGEFVLTDKSGFGAKGYDGKVTSKEEMSSMFLRRGKEAPDANRKAFVKKMANIWDIYEAATPENFRGYVHGDLLYFTKPGVEDNHFVFTPNIVTYRVKAKSEIGKQISNSQSGVVLHAKIELDGSKSKVDASELNSGNLLIMPPVTLTKGPKVQADNLDKVASIAKQSSQKIDMLLDDEFLKSNKLSSFKTALYTYVNNMTKARKLDNLVGDWSSWLASAKMSEPMKERMQNHVSNNTDGMKALFTVIMGIMSVKNDIIAQLDASEADVEAYTDGQRGGEGYVIGQGDSKLVNRSGFSAANMTKER